MKSTRKYNVWASSFAHTYATLYRLYLEGQALFERPLLEAGRLSPAIKPFNAQMILPDGGIQGLICSGGGAYL